MIGQDNDAQGVSNEVPCKVYATIKHNETHA
jgi:hypothetical protein